MMRNMLTVIVTTVLLGCEGSPHIPVAAGFVNQTQHSDAELQAIWTEAQQSVAQKIDLNPPRDFETTCLRTRSPVIRVPGALTLEDFLAATEEHRSDPTGILARPQPCNARYTTAYSFYQPELTK